MRRSPATAHSGAPLETTAVGSLAHRRLLALSCSPFLFSRSATTQACDIVFETGSGATLGERRFTEDPEDLTVDGEVVCQTVKEAF